MKRLPEAVPGTHRRAVVRVATLVVTLSVLPGGALAHGGHGNSNAIPLLPPALFLAGVAVLGVSVFLDSKDRLERIHADAGVFLGVVGVLAGLVALFI